MRRFSLARPLLGALVIGMASLSMGSLAACGGSQKPKAPKEMTARDIVQRYKPAIVRIENDMGDKRMGVGTGFIISEQGRIATNLHVLEGPEGLGPGELSVKLADGSVLKVQRVVAIDQERDLAVIEVDTKQKLPTVALGDSDGVVPGDPVIAIGNPMRLDYTVSDGLISSIRPIEQNTVLQISAPISQGSSGGPLFNSYGEVIGVAKMILTEGQNLNFGVPINYLRPLMEHPGSETVEEFAARYDAAKSAASASDVVKTGTDTVYHRQIPEHDIEMLDQCSPRQVLATFQGINEAIKLGAPAYNAGHHDACFSIYKETATVIQQDEGMCAPIRDAFAAGLKKAEGEANPTAKAWAMRDTFDGLLDVIVRKARSMER